MNGIEAFIQTIVVLPGSLAILAFIVWDLWQFIKRDARDTVSAEKPQATFLERITHGRDSQKQHLEGDN